MRFVHLVIAPAILAACIVADVVDSDRAVAAVEKPVAKKAAPKSSPSKSPAIEPHLLAEFKATDTNKDGTLSRAEVDARVKRMAAGQKQFSAAQADTLTDRYFAIADANHNGSISAYEWQGLMRALASRYDTNHDGVVSLAERQAARAAAVAEAKAADAKGR